MCRATNRPGVAEPEVYFRIVHVSLQGQNGPGGGTRTAATFPYLPTPANTPTPTWRLTGVVELSTIVS